MQKWLSTLGVALFISVGVSRAQESPSQIKEARTTFSDHSGVRLTFEESELPPGAYHDLMVPLPAARRLAACRIAVRESHKLPRHFLQDVGLKAIGIFDSCASRRGDGFRPYDQQLKGYRYFGIYNGHDAVAAAYYSDEQLPLTLHHEIFHHIDATTDPGEKEDRRLIEILAGKNLYPAPKIKPADLARLKKISKGLVLTGAVSEYAQKNPVEDKAETARHLMSALADSLVQVAEQPELAGSQRILHVLDKYRRALRGNGPTVDWFTDVALDRQDKTGVEPLADEPGALDVLTLTAQLRSFGSGSTPMREQAVRTLLREAETLANRKRDTPEATQLVDASAMATQQLLKSQINPSDGDRRFVVAGKEDADGVNWTLRNNVANFGDDAARLAAIAAVASESSQTIVLTQLQNLRLVSRFYVFISQHWRMTEKTRQVFERTRDQFTAALAVADPEFARRLAPLDLESLADLINSQGALLAVDNAYLKNIDVEIKDPALRNVIRGVQPACVRLGGGSGVNLLPAGRILTAAHVARRRNAKLTIEFPDGHEYAAVCTAIDDDLDLAICSISIDGRLPFARVANAAPGEETRVVCIGQPGAVTPKGEPTGYQPFCVSVGAIRGFVGDPLGSQKLGRTKHDAWTYWGHSGSPLFDERGQIVAMHNSWDPQTAMRHAVTQQAIVKFLRDHELGNSIASPTRLTLENQ